MNSAMKRGRRRFLIDGFPRSLDQAIKFEEKVYTFRLLYAATDVNAIAVQIHEQNFTILLDCPENVIKERLLERAKASGRVDDNMESITKRLRTFRNGNQAVESHLRQKGPFKSVSTPFIAIINPADIWRCIRFNVLDLRMMSMLWLSQQ